MSPTTTPTPTVTLPETRAFTTLALADELVRDPSLLVAYFAAFGADDDATLLVYAGNAQAEQAGAALVAAAARAGLDFEDGPDVALLATPVDAQVEIRLSRRAGAILSRDADLSFPVSRPVVAPEDAGTLRAFAEGLWRATDGPQGAPYSYEAAVAHLVQRHGIPEAEVRGGSVPQASLDFMLQCIDERFDGTRPLRLLHVGNFVGVSLSHLLAGVRRSQPGSTAVSVDPDLVHRDVVHPQGKVIDLLCHFGLQDRHVLVCGYSLEKSVSNDGAMYGSYDPAANFASEAAPQNVLPALVALGQRFDAAFIDGNHDAGYLRRELEQLTHLLEPGGLLILDDVDQCWEEIRDLFAQVTAATSEWPFERFGYDGRVGVLRRV